MGDMIDLRIQKVEEVQNGIEFMKYQRNTCQVIQRKIASRKQLGTMR